MFSVTFYLVAINVIFGGLRNEVDASLFADNLAIYITTRSQRVATRALQGMTNKTVSMTFRKRRKTNEEQI